MQQQIGFNLQQRFKTHTYKSKKHLYNYGRAPSFAPAPK